jgi:hypothetical protein
LKYDSACAELRSLLAKWDPIGVNPGLDWPEDEYDCLIPGLYARLQGGQRDEEILAFLRERLVNYFGLEPVPERDRAFAGELVRWWKMRSAAPS